VNEENNSDRFARCFSDVESLAEYATLPEDRFKEEDARVSIYVRSYRRLNTDPDGISIKAVLDAVVERGVLPDDSSKQIKSITFENFTGCSKEEERTLIIITEGD